MPNSVIIKDPATLNIFKEASKTLFSEDAKKILDFEHTRFVDGEGYEITEVSLEIPVLTEEQIESRKDLVEALDERDSSIEILNEKLNTALNQLKSMQVFLAFKGVQYNRDWKQKLQEEREGRN